MHFVTDMIANHDSGRSIKSLNCDNDSRNRSSTK